MDNRIYESVVGNPQVHHFVNNAVANAGVKSLHGWHVGPIPYANDGWIPPRQVAAAEAGTAIPIVSNNDNADDTRPHDAEVLSLLNPGVCCIDLDGRGTMCGVTFKSQPSLRRHYRQFHPGALVSVRLAMISVPERLAGFNALKHVVLNKIWRNASFLKEPGRGPRGGIIDEYATALEYLAATDAKFAARWGTLFHREGVFRLRPAREEYQADLPRGQRPASSMQPDTRIHDPLIKPSVSAGSDSGSDTPIVTQARRVKRGGRTRHSPSPVKSPDRRQSKAQRQPAASTGRKRIRTNSADGTTPSRAILLDSSPSRSKRSFRPTLNTANARHRTNTITVGGNQSDSSRAASVSSTEPTDSDASWAQG